MMKVHQQSPMEFFKERIEQAIAHQRVDSSQNTAYYLVQLLNAFIRPEQLYSKAGADPELTPGELLCQALASRGLRKMSLLRLTGDLSLYLSGFQADHLHYRKLGLDYYIHLGVHAYAAVASSRHGRDNAELFEDLASNFTRFVDVLSEVSEQCALSDESQLLNLYERWLHTGSERTAAVLRRQGIMLAPGTRQIQ